MHETISPPDHLKAMLQLCDGGVKETKEGFVRGFLSTASQCGSNLDTFLPMLLKEALAQTASDIGAWILILEPRDNNKRLIASKIQGHLSENGIRQWQAWHKEPDKELLQMPSTQDECCTHPSRYSLLAGSRSVLRAPFLDGNALIGFVQVESSKPNHDTEGRSRKLQELTSQAVPAICRILLRDAFTQFGGPPHLVGVSDAFLNLEQQIRRLATFPARTVLITGERGAGKELAAWALHCWSPRRNRPFVPVLVSAFAEDLLADELFGHQRHAFTGALGAREGKFLAANGGTLFLDEVADLSLTAQSALLRVLETGEVPQIGRDLPLRTDVRILAATNRDLGQLIADGKFRADLYDRLNTLQIHVPPLGARKDDIPVLASHFLRLYCHQCGTDPENTCPPEQQDLSDLAGCASKEFYEALQQYDWPGNVRELQNVLLKLRASVADRPLQPRHIPGNMKPNTRLQAEDLSLRRAIKDHIEKVLRTTDYNQAKASRLLEIPLSTFRSKAKKLGVELRKC